MNRQQRSLVFALLVLAAGLAAAGGKAEPPRRSAEEKTARLQALLAETIVNTQAFPEEMPLSKFLAAVREQLPDKAAIALRLEEKELGKEAARLANAPVRCSGSRVPLHTILRKALAHVSDKEEFDYGIRPDGIVITRARLAVHSMRYDVGDIVRRMPALLPQLKKDNEALLEDVDATDGLALLVRLLANTVTLRPWEKVECLNDTRLSVLASPTRHAEVADLLAALRRLGDVAVVMNARLYEVDRDFYRKEVAPLFAPDKQAKDRPVVVRLKGPLFQKITRQKLVLESDNVKLAPNVKKTFLSRRSVFRFAARSMREGARGEWTGTGLAGVSFEVRAVVSADRRFLRLHLTQRVAQLAGIGKSKTLEPATGAEEEIESPNLCKSAVSGALTIPDAAPILMPVVSRPPSEPGADRVWLLVARPFIWIEEEAKELRRQGEELSPKAIWDSEVPGEEEAPQSARLPARLPLTDDVKAVLQALLTDVLTNPELASARAFYGTAADRTFTLEDSAKLGWPKGFRPNTHGYKLVRVRLDPFQDQRRVLGIRLDRFDLKGKATPFGGPIEVCLYNAGGTANGAVIGGCSVYYAPRRIGKRWTVDYLGLLDP